MTQEGLAAVTKLIDRILCALFISLMQGNSLAATLDFTESTDFTYLGPGDFVGALDFGQNFVRGTIESPGTLGDSVFDNVDWFHLSLPVNLEIVSISVNVQTSGDIQTDDRQFGTASIGGRGSDGDEVFNFTGSGNQGGGFSEFTFSSVPSVLEFVVLVNPEFSVTSIPFSAAYEWKIDVAETAVVPLPAAFWLFSAGLVSMIGMARRKRI